MAISQKSEKINTSRNVACHVWTKEKEEKNSQVVTYLKINSGLYFSHNINKTGQTFVSYSKKETTRNYLVMICSHLKWNRERGKHLLLPKCCAGAA